VKVDYWDVEGMADAIYSICTYDAMSEFLSREGKEEVDNIKWEYAGQKVRIFIIVYVNNKKQIHYEKYMFLFPNTSASQAKALSIFQHWR
jgi:(1->4)-alpha-D-glucan synthase (ADP-glucose)